MQNHILNSLKRLLRAVKRIITAQRVSGPTKPICGPPPRMPRESKLTIAERAYKAGIINADKLNAVYHAASIQAGMPQNEHPLTIQPGKKDALPTCAACDFVLPGERGQATCYAEPFPMQVRIDRQTCRLFKVRA